MKTYRIAVAGVTGAVGTEMLRMLEERNFPVGEIRMLASSRSVGKVVKFKGEEIRVEELAEDSFKGIDIALFSAGGGRSKAFAPPAVESGAVVVDNSSAFRMDPDVPLVIPEINPEDISTHKGIIANPNCTTIVMLMALYPLRSFGIRRVVASSYQAASGAGAWAIEELRRQVIDWALNEARNEVFGEEKEVELIPNKFPQQIAFNLFPHVADFLETGYSQEEMKCHNETRKIFHDDNLQVTATTVRVPVFRSHAVAVNIEFEKAVTPEEARIAIDAAEGVSVLDNPAENLYPTPLMVSGKMDCLVGRVRKDYTVPNGLSLWVVGDQLLKGAALNAVQIAEKLV